ncbi:hypothetical protein FGO68_gene15470 [Halteria grandinella]|uniref:MORN repeat protein n=1 Tax=Halteria grandinella TaxID=5974 RepID=A0A8J8NX96_HALGN|nr:hypothetical protein FGO68_gene15470 [Halteria grandinella]
MQASTSINNIIQEKQQPCPCNRGLLVRYYCAQENCAQHRDNIFFCDTCFSEIMKKRVPHFILQITDLLDELKNKWMALIEKEGKLYSTVSAKFNPLRNVYECLEKHAVKLNEIAGRLVFKDMVLFEKFHEEFKQYISRYEEYIQNYNIAQLHGLDRKCSQFDGTLDREFSYLSEISKPDFIYENYKCCIESCPIPQIPDNSFVREHILLLKVKLGEQNINAATTKPKEQVNPQELADVVSNLRHIVNQQGAKINGYLSLFGTLKDTSSFVSRSFNIKGAECQAIDENHKWFREEYNSRLQNLEHQSNAQNIDIHQKIAELKNSLKEATFKAQNIGLKFEEEIQRLQQFKKNSNPHNEQVSQEIQQKIQAQIKTVQENMNKEMKALSDRQSIALTQFETNLSIIDQYTKKEFRLTAERYEQLSSHLQSVASAMQVAQPAYPLLSQQQYLESFMAPQQIAPQAPQFSQEMLDWLISTFNSPLNNYIPQLNPLGQSKLAEYILQHGWHWSLQKLNEKAHINKAIEWNTFEGANRNGMSKLQQGVYYGQMENGKRNGFGIVYCTDEMNRSWLYECEWKQGSPINNGRYVWIDNNKWKKWEGRVTEYLVKDNGSYLDEDGVKYQGVHKQGLRFEQANLKQGDRFYQHVESQIMLYGEPLGTQKSNQKNQSDQEKKSYKGLF